MKQQYSNNDLQKAVALFYDGETEPLLSAKGTGQEAEDIIRIAQEYEIALCDNAALVELLMTLELGDTIPESLYHSVAHIIAFAYRLQSEINVRS